MKHLYIADSPYVEKEIHLALKLNTNFSTDYKNTSFSAFSKQIVKNKDFLNHPYFGLVKECQRDHKNTKLYLIFNIEAFYEYKRKFS